MEFGGRIDTNVAKFPVLAEVYERKIHTFLLTHVCCG